MNRKLRVGLGYFIKFWAIMLAAGMVVRLVYVVGWTDTPVSLANTLPDLMNVAVYTLMAFFAGLGAANREKTAS